MPLRVRLSITLVAIVLVPLTVTALAVLVMINQQQQRLIADQLEYGASSVSAVLRTTASRADDAAGDLITAGAGKALASGDKAVVAASVRGFSKGSGADFFAIVDKKGGVVGKAYNREPRYGVAAGNAPDADTQVATMAKQLDGQASSYAIYSSVAITVND